MSKILTVVGATGIQGGSVISALLGNPAYTIRAITRNSKSEAAKSLAAQGLQVVEADMNDVESLKAAFAGSHSIYAMTNFFEALDALGIDKSIEVEAQQGKNLADAAAATESLQHYVWSTLANSRQASGGSVIVPYCESKNRIDEHILSIPHLAQKTTFFMTSWYASNLRYAPYKPIPLPMTPGSTAKQTYVQLIGVPTSVLLPMFGDETKNVGLFVKAILEQPEKTLPRKIVSGMVEMMSFAETAAAFSEAQSVDLRCLEIDRDEYLKLWPIWSQTLDRSHSLLQLLGEKKIHETDAPMDVVTKEDLGIKGLVGTAEAFKTSRVLG